MVKSNPRKSKGWRSKHKTWSKNKNHIAKRDDVAQKRAAREETLASPTTAAATEQETQPRQKKQQQRHTSPHEEAVKRAAIEYFYERMDCPPRDQWDGPSGVVLQIRDLLQLPRGEQKHTKTIRRVLEVLSNEKQQDTELEAAEVADQEEAEREPPSPYKNTRGRAGGRPKMMTEGECNRLGQLSEQPIRARWDVEFRCSERLDGSHWAYERGLW